MAFNATDSTESGLGRVLEQVASKGGQIAHGLIEDKLVTRQGFPYFSTPGAQHTNACLNFAKTLVQVTSQGQLQPGISI